MATERESALPLSELDRASASRLEHLMGQDPAMITAGDRAFLEARRDYLTAGQRKDFGIGGKKAAEPKEPKEPKTAKEPKAPKTGKGGKGK